MHESVLAEEREERIRALYQTGRRLLGVRSAADLAEVSAQELAAQLDASVLAVFYRADGEVQNRFVQGEDVFSSDRERVVCRETYRSCNACGRGTKLYAGANAYYSPVVTQNGVSGVVGVAPLDGRPLTENQTEFLNTVLTQLAVVLERETLYRRQEETQTQIASERLRSDMGAAMAPAALETILTHLSDTCREPDYYDLIVTGDLGCVGHDILLDLALQSGWDLSGVAEDCGMMIYDREKQDVHAGGSGCGCSAGVLAGHLLPKFKTGELKRLLFCATGALMSPTTAMQGESVLGICHAVAIEAEKPA